ncbi:glycosyltransferase family 39 protein [Endozoicomonas sp. 4G]|uniref:glycosyltransferase family 39 protein n=1 Tax=Endozoicomonas sp. 4G TaxID=2872754 RepID=UPI002078BFFA|nr:glycosyltransferase family 39 protein [Endozoicomonas sp. 4G]
MLPSIEDLPAKFPPKLSDSLSDPLFNPQRLTSALILVFLTIHLLLAALIPLTHYEAHYALYGTYLDWSYLDHPPLTGWLQTIPQLFSDHDFLLRLIPIVLLTASQYLLARSCERLFPTAHPWLAPITLLIINGAIVTHLGITMAPEVPLLFAALLCLHSLLTLQNKDRWQNWLGLGFALGLAGLSKYTGVTLALSSGLILLMNRGFAVLKHPGLYLTMAITLLMISPVLYWNWQNDWASFQFQLGYQFEESDSTWSLASAFEAIAIQIGVYSPLLFIGGLLGSARVMRSGNPGGKALVLMAWPILLLFFWMSGAGRSSAHWTLISWYLLAPLAALWVSECWGSRAVRWLAKGSGSFSAVLLMAFLVIPLPMLEFPDMKHPLGKTMGWEEAAEEGQRLLQTIEPDPDYEEPTLLVTNWHYASQLSWYTQGAPVRDLSSDPSQYVRWFGAADRWTHGIVILPDNENTISVPNMNCTLLEKTPVEYGESLVGHFSFFYCQAIQSGQLTSL